MSAIKIDEEAIRKLAAILNDTGLVEVEVKSGDNVLRVSKGGTVVQAAAPMAVSAAAAPSVGAAPVANTDLPPGTQVTSPMVGTAYLSSSPGAPTFVKVGDTVKEGDTLLIVEAMKVMNPIKAPKGGTINRILVSTAQPVEFGEVLVIIG
jgi:acetyl-CoA carboxylase biotin carboxyl carrier protein